MKLPLFPAFGKRPLAAPLRPGRAMAAGLVVAGQTMTLRFLVDGKSAPKLAVKVIPGGARYRDAVGEIDLQTDADGRTTLTWPAAGLYWLQAAIRYDQAEAPATRRLISYAATLEVLPD